MTALTDEVLSQLKTPKPKIKLGGIEQYISDEFEIDIVQANISGNLQNIIDDLENLSADVDSEKDLSLVWNSEVKKVYGKLHGTSNPDLSVNSSMALSLFTGRETSSIFDSLESLTGGNYNRTNYYQFRKNKAKYLLNKETDVSAHEDNIAEIIRVMKLYL